MKSDSPLKKHHFWILFGLAPLLTLIAVFLVSGSVGGKIAEQEKNIDEAKKAIAGKQNPKPEALLKEAEKIYEKVSNKQGDLHKLNWDRQKHLFTWPDGGNLRLLKQFENLNLKFGDPLPTNDGQFDEFRKPEVYIYEFSSIKKDGSGAPGTGMADKVAPTQFRGGWQAVLRHVNDFGQAQINKDQVWLMMEDIWVQRSLLDAVQTINADMSTFRRAKLEKDGNFVYDTTYDDDGNKIAVDVTGKPIVEGGKYKTVPTPDDEKRKVVFRNRIWGLELELKREGGSQRLVGTLTNLSERLQLMGVGNVMTLHVRFAKGPTAQPLVFKIGGEFMPGKGALKRDASGRDVPANVLPIVPIEDHLVPPAMSAEEIVRVDQIFDIRTVPVKRIEALALGFLDSRNAAKTLVGPAAPFAQEPAAVDPNAGGMGMGFGMGAEGRPAAVAVGPGPGGVATGNPGRGGGPLAAVVDANKKRYLEVTPQVRRMPVGIVVVVDQAYMQDMLLAFANSPLRFQITQVNWTRFRGTLSGIGNAAGSGGSGEGISIGGGGTVNFGGSFDPDGPRGGSSRQPGPGPGPGPGFPGPMGMFPMGSGMMPGSGPGYPGAGQPSTVSESQITSSLVELSIYGIVSLYEKYEAPKPPTDGAAPTPPAPAPGPMPMTPMMPMGEPTPMTPKMRRRKRA